MTPLWLGIDVGTTAIKAAVYQSDGTQISHGECPSRVSTPRPGHSEQNMSDVWDGVCTALKKAVASVDVSQIQSLGVAAQGDGLWALDADGAPVGPALLWNDTRAARVLSDLDDAALGTIAKACRTALWPGTLGPLYRWMRDREPERAARVSHVMHCAGWVGYCLTGKMAVDFSDASIPFLDLGTGHYSDAALAALGVPELHSALLPPQSAESQLGTLSAKAAAATGLPEGLPVSVGTLDLSAMIVGMGMDQPGDTMMILGTTAVVNILRDAIDPSETPVGASAYHANGRTLTRILAPTTGAAAFDWFCALHPQTLGGETPAEIAGKLNALAQEVPAGANGVTFLPHLNGERAPFVAPEATGAFFGLRSTSTKADMGRAVMEGAAFSLRDCYLSECGTLPDTPIRLTGGGAKNALWCQIIADVMQTRIEVSAASDHGLWGAACLGAAANGKGVASSLAAREETSLIYDPDPADRPAYDAAFARYKSLSHAAQALWAETSKETS
ncbi:xylulokinase [Cognatishimia maritima]|uniref:Erythritol kinase n=1 Tax=Cognatishimia maritima TaxID=870908 RepID=A0A1M5USK2_9RHOB|nr:FGGY-family carbohydrate kinase [Cognatishimia maritima]SHH66022.1 erythritol kinase [Cognatishimia maritima]